jgi:hypothetical protein
MKVYHTWLEFGSRFSLRKGNKKRGQLSFELTSFFIFYAFGSLLLTLLILTEYHYLKTAHDIPAALCDLRV